MSIMREMGDLPTLRSRPEEPNSLRLRSLDNDFRKTSMNVAIVGSRFFEDYSRLTKCIAEVLADRRILMSEVRVISGGTVGVDALAQRYSREVLGKEPYIFAADRKQFGRSAGQKCNNEIVEAADLVIAFPGKGRGTWDMIYLAWKKGIPVDVFPIW